MIKNRKGMSDVVTMVLVILLVVVAVVTIWTFVQKPVQKAGTQIEKATACADVELQLVSCKASGSNLDATVKVAQGSPVAVRFIVDQSAGGTVVFEGEAKVTGTVPTTSNVGTLAIVGGVTGATTPAKISATPVVTTDDGTQTICPGTAKVTCS